LQPLPEGWIEAERILLNFTDSTAKGEKLVIGSYADSTPEDLFSMAPPCVEES